MTHQPAPRIKSVKWPRLWASLVLIFLSTFGLAIWSFGVDKASAATDSLDTGANIVGAITIDCSGQDLNFGAIISSGVAGTVEVDAANGVSDSGGATYVNGAASGICTLGGNVSAPYEIDYVVSDLTGPGTDMTLTDLVSDNANGQGPFMGLGTHAASLDATGADVLSFGGTLNVGVNQAVGLYTGTISVTVDYP